MCAHDTFDNSIGLFGRSTLLAQYNQLIGQFEKDFQHPLACWLHEKVHCALFQQRSFPHTRYTLTHTHVGEVIQWIYIPPGILNVLLTKPFDDPPTPIGGHHFYEYPRCNISLCR